jgi:hypothetical protein
MDPVVFPIDADTRSTPSNSFTKIEKTLAVYTFLIRNIHSVDMNTGLYKHQLKNLKKFRVLHFRILDHQQAIFLHQNT